MGIVRLGYRRVHWPFPSKPSGLSPGRTKKTINPNATTPSLPQVTISQMENLEQNKLTNRIHSLILILAMAAIMSISGYCMLGIYGLVGALVVAFFSCLFGQRVSTRVVMRMYRARPLRPEEAPALWQLFQSLVQRAELEAQPALYYVPSRMPNAFATGYGRQSAVALTDGILQMMSQREIAGILAHEIAHLMHHDTKVMGLADSIARMISTLSRFGLILLLFSTPLYFANGAAFNWLLSGLILFVAPTITLLLQLALSRSREFNADLGAVELTGEPHGLASALKKLERLTNAGSLWRRIVAPGQHRAQPSLLRTHPPTSERIRELMEHAAKPTYPLADPIQVIRQREHHPRIRVIQMPKVRRTPRYHISNGMWY